MPNFYILPPAVGTRIFKGFDLESSWWLPCSSQLPAQFSSQAVSSPLVSPSVAPSRCRPPHTHTLPTHNADSVGAWFWFAFTRAFCDSRDLVNYCSEAEPVFDSDILNQGLKREERHKGRKDTPQSMTRQRLRDLNVVPGLLKGFYPLIWQSGGPRQGQEAQETA